jgi:cytochrome c oxidase subunit 2
MVEVVWTIIPVIILVCLSIPSLQILYYIEENDPFLTLKVMGHQWYWNYEIIDINIEFDAYMLPEVWAGEVRLIEADHRIIIPTNKDIRNLVTAADVLHCWALPSLGVKADAVPGRLNQVFINIIRPAIIYGQCSEICGANHSFIPITIESIKTYDFLTWVGDF